MQPPVHELMMPTPRTTSTALRPQVAAFARRRVDQLRGDEGQALVTVIVVVALLVILATVAFWSAQASSSNTSGVNADSQAGASANAGIAAAVYSIETADFLCSLSDTSPGGPLLTPSAGGPPNAGSAAYQVSVSYYSVYPPSGQPLSCSSNTATGTPQSAVITSVGSGSLGPTTTSQTISETVYLSPAPDNYVVFSGSSGLSLVNLSVSQSAGTTPVQGAIYANGDVTGPGSGPLPPGGCNIQATSITAFGYFTLANNCTISGSVLLGTDPSGNGYLTMTQGTIDGNVTLSDGSLTMNNATIEGFATAGGSSPDGNILLCPNPPGPNPPTGCPSGPGSPPAGPSSIDGSATAAGTVTVGNQLESNSTSSPCTATTSGGSTIDGCITVGSVDPVYAPAAVALPSLTAPTSGSTWSTAGYTSFYSNASCTGTGTGTVAYDIANETAATVIVANCAYTITSQLQIKYDTALFATGGITAGAGAGVGLPAGTTSAHRLSLIVPTPTSSYTCGSSLDETLGNLGPWPNGLSMFLYSPCTVSVGSNFAGSIIAGTVTASAPTKVTYAPFTPPGLTFGYQAVVEQRYVTKG